MTKINEGTQILQDAWEKDPENWKLGFIYYNRQDKRVLIPKRIKILGMTFNFANPKALIFITIATVLATYFLSK